MGFVFGFMIGIMVGVTIMGIIFDDIPYNKFHKNNDIDKT